MPVPGIPPTGAAEGKVPAHAASPAPGAGARSYLGAGASSCLSAGLGDALPCTQPMATGTLSMWHRFYHRPIDHPPAVTEPPPPPTATFRGATGARVHAAAWWDRSARNDHGTGSGLSIRGG